MNSKDKKKIILVAVLLCVVLPGVYVLQENGQPENEIVTQSLVTSPESTALGSSNHVAKTPDEEPPRFVNITNATDRLALQIIAASPNQNEGLLNEAAKQSSRLFNTVLQNRTIQSQIADVELNIKKAQLSGLQVDKEIARITAEVEGVEDTGLLPPPVTNVPQGRVNIPPAILDEQPIVQIAPEPEKEVIFEEFNLKGITTMNDSYTAVGLFRGKSLVLRVGSVVNGVYKVVSITESSLVLEKQGKQFEFHVNV